MEDLNTTTRQITLGEYRVGIDFNVANNPAVDAIKRAAADLIDLCSHYSNGNPNPEAKRVFAIAMTHFEEGAMNAVKGATKKPLPPELDTRNLQSGGAIAGAGPTSQGPA